MRVQYYINVLNTPDITKQSVMYVYSHNKNTVVKISYIK